MVTEKRTPRAAIVAHCFASLNHINEKYMLSVSSWSVDYRLHNQSGGSLCMELRMGQSNIFKCKKINADLVNCARISAKLHLQNSDLVLN